MTSRRWAPLLLAVQVAAFWPVWRWVWARVGDGSGEGAALAACAAALLIRPAGAPDASRPPSSLRFASLLTFAYAVSAALAPPVMSAALAFCALLCTWSAWRWGAQPHPAALGLVVLALPAIPTAQFVLGFPLRVATGELAARMLRAAGLGVEREGSVLRWGHRMVAVDAPCSGVHMLWTALLLSLLLALFGGLDRRRTAGLALCAVALAIAGNAVRVAALFFPETGFVTLPSGGHEGVGVVVFALATTPLIVLFRRWRAESA